MKRAAFLISIGGALLLSGCDQAPRGGGQTGDLAKQIEAIQDRDRDTRVKMRIVQSFPNHPRLGGLFNDGFWQCTYDSAWSDCASRCSKATATGFQACIDNHREGQERIDCVKKNSDSGAACLANCPVQMSPTSPPNCAGGGIM